jgi:hypothetical protein
MKIHTKTTWDIETGKVLFDSFYLYSGPLALCDRALTQQAQQAESTAAGTAAGYGAQAAGIQGSIVPRLESYAAGNTPGYGPFGLSEMETAAEQTGAGATGAAQERSRLRAMRTGNAAGLGATDVASAGEGARATGGALQSILANNAKLKESQQEMANRSLSGILGEDIGAQTAEAGLVPEDIKTEMAATQSDPWAGWMKQFGDVVGIGGNVAKGILGATGGGG